MSLFDRYIGIDYSGAETPEASLSGLRVYIAEDNTAPREEKPPPSPRKYWTRRGLAEWLIAILQDTPRTLVGIDHGFSFPLSYFVRYKIKQDWDAFLDDFCKHWPTDAPHTYVDFIRAYATCRWLQGMDRHDCLPRFFDPPLTPETREAANIEGWILGVS